MAARLVSPVNTIRHLRGCSFKYSSTFFLDSATSTASTINPLSENSLVMSFTSDSSLLQYGHQVVQNWNRTTFPFTDSLLNCSPSRSWHGSEARAPDRRTRQKPGM